jgi:hypothetical protein
MSIEHHLPPIQIADWVGLGESVEVNSDDEKVVGSKSVGLDPVESKRVGSERSVGGVASLSDANVVTSAPHADVARRTTRNTKAGRCTLQQPALVVVSCTQCFW